MELLFLIPIVLFICIFGFVAFREKMRHEERLELIKSGRELPAVWERPSKSRNRGLFWGIVITGFGAGLQVLQGITFIADIFKDRLFRYRGAEDYFFGLVFLGIGIALMYYHKLHEKQINASVSLPDKGVLTQQPNNRDAEKLQ